jgi:hypothetical protein
VNQSKVRITKVLACRRLKLNAVLVKLSVDQSAERLAVLTPRASECEAAEGFAHHLEYGSIGWGEFDWLLIAFGAAIALSPKAITWLALEMAERFSARLVPAASRTITVSNVRFEMSFGNSYGEAKTTEVRVGAMAGATEETFSIVAVLVRKRLFSSAASAGLSANA